MEKYNDEVEVRKESVVEREISQLSEVMMEVTNLSDELENRLASVLRQQPEAKNGGTPQEQLTALPSAIREQRERAISAVCVLKSILSRLEL